MTESTKQTATPITISRQTAYIGISCAVAALVLVIWLVPAVVTIAIGGSALALLLSFPVRLLQRVMARKYAVLASLLGVVAFIAVALLIVVPPVLSQLSQLVDDLPQIVDRADGQLREVIDDLEANGLLPSDSDEVVGDLQNGLLGRASTALEAVLEGILGTITGAVGLVVTGFGILFVAVYLLLDAEKFRRKVVEHSPARYQSDMEQLWDDMGDSLSRYLGGLLVICAAQGVLAGIGLLILGVPYALLLGLWIAITALIPYLGAWLGAIPALILAYLESPLTAVWVFLLYFGINTIEGNFLTPRIQGEAVQVHPVLVLLTVVAVGGLFGLLGVILAIPMLAVGRVIFDFLRARLRIEDEATTAATR